MTFNEIPAPRPELVRQLADDAAFSERHHPFFHFAQLRVETQDVIFIPVMFSTGKGIN